MPFILSSQITSPVILGVPRPSFGAADLASDTTTPENANTEIAPDWGGLEEKYGDDGDSSIVTPKRDLEDEPAPDPETKAKELREEEQKKESEEKEKKEEKPEPEKEEKKGKTEKKKEEKSKTEDHPTIPEDDKDIDDLRPRDGAPSTVVKDFKALQARMKEERARARAFQAQLVEAKKVAPAADPKEIEELKRQIEELTPYRAAVQLENDPDFQKEFETKQTEAESGLKALLTGHPRLRMPEKSDDPKIMTWEKLQAIGVATEKGRELVSNILKHVNQKVGDPLLVEEITDAWKGVAKVAKERADKLTQIKGSRETLHTHNETRAKAEQQEWGTKADASLLDLVKERRWANYLTPKEDATPENKASVEAHNKQVDDEIKPQFHKAITAIYNRDPQKGMEICVKAIERDIFEKEITQLKKDLEERDKRIEELSGDIGRVRKVSRPPGTGAETAPKKVITEDMTTDEAVDAFRRNQGLLK